MHTNVLADDATEERIPAPRRWVQPPPKLLSHLSDERLVARVRAGDDRAFEALYDRHHRSLLAFCRHLLGSAEEAEDALQHTFIAAHRALRSDERPVMLRAWLFTIARNRCLSLLRSRRNVVALTELEPTLPATVGLAAQVEQRADLQALVRDLHALSDDQRAALVLAELGDLDHEQIANVLGVRRARVATLVFQARASLMETRKARDTACSDIQEQLATLRGGALRRSTLRRHVESCPACQAFRAEVRRQRAAMALILPVIPSLGSEAQRRRQRSPAAAAQQARRPRREACRAASRSSAAVAAPPGTGAAAGSAAVASGAAVAAAPAAATRRGRGELGVGGRRGGRCRGGGCRRRGRGGEDARRQGPHRRGGRQRRARACTPRRTGWASPRSCSPRRSRRPRRSPRPARCSPRARSPRAATGPSRQARDTPAQPSRRAARAGRAPARAPARRRPPRRRASRPPAATPPRRRPARARARCRAR